MALLWAHAPVSSNVQMPLPRGARPWAAWKSPSQKATLTLRVTCRRGIPVEACSGSYGQTLRWIRLSLVTPKMRRARRARAEAVLRASV